MAAAAVTLSRLFHRLCGQDHRRAAGQHPHHRALSAARRRPARTEIQDQPAALGDRPRRRDAGRGGRREADRRQRAVSTTAARRRAGRSNIYGSATLNNLFGQHEALDVHLCGRGAAERTQLRRPRLQTGAHQRGTDLLRRRQRRLGHARHGRSSKSLHYRTLGPYGDAGFSFPVLRSREKQSHACRPWSTAATTRATRSARRSRTIVCAAFAARSTPISPINGRASTSSTSRSAKGIQGLGSTTNDNPLASRLVGRVDYDKIEATAARTQPLFDRFSAYVSLYGQYAGTPLLVPEQCGFGGRYFGRAFDPSQLLGDSCFEAVGELRYDLADHTAALSQCAALRLHRLRRSLYAGCRAAARRRSRRPPRSAAASARLVRSCRRRSFGRESN